MKMTTEEALSLHRSAGNILSTIKYKESVNDTLRLKKAVDEEVRKVLTYDYDTDIQNNMLDILKLKSSYRKIMEDIVLKLC